VGDKARIGAAQSAHRTIRLAPVVPRLVTGVTSPVVVGEPLIIVLNVHHRSETDLLQVADTGRLSGGRSRSCKDWEQDSCKYRDDCDYHEELDNGKTPM